MMTVREGGLEEDSEFGLSKSTAHKDHREELGCGILGQGICQRGTAAAGGKDNRRGLFGGGWGEGAKEVPLF
jgi:hypothetical protein